MHEIITLQLGQRSNYVATHFWNAQESYFTYSADEESPVDHDIHFRPGIGADGAETFTPRTVIYDLKGGFGSMRKINALYETTSQQDGLTIAKGLWDGPTATQILPSIEENQYLRSLNEGLETPELTPDTVRYWSDFSRVFYHPRSIVQLNEYELNSALMPFERWEGGEELFSSLDKEHELLDRDVRPFAEESDQMQGLQIIAGVDDAWGGFAARYTDALRDEFGKTSIWIWGIQTGNKQSKEKRALKSVNSARACLDLSSQASLYVPVFDPPSSLPVNVSLDKTSEWHTAGLLSTALESITIPSRLRAMNKFRSSLLESESVINTNGNQKIADLQFTIVDSEGHSNLPSGREADTRVPSLSSNEKGVAQGPEKLEATNGGLSQFDIDLSGHGNRNGGSTDPEPHIFGRLDVQRGYSLPTQFDLSDQAANKPRPAADAPRIKISHTNLRYPLLDSFPGIYGAHPKHNGSIAVHAGLSSSSRISAQIRAMSSSVKRLVGPVDRETLCNGLSEIAEAYQEGWNTGSDEDSDDD